MKKFDLITRPYDDIHDLMNQFFDRNLPTFKAFPAIKIDVQETEKEYIVEADLPGINKENIQLDFVDHNLLINIYQKREEDKDEKNYVRRERSYSSMRRSIYLPDAQPDNVDAKLENGVLTIRLDKIDKDQQRPKIEIK